MKTWGTHGFRDGAVGRRSVRQTFSHIWRTQCSSAPCRTFQQFAWPLPAPPQSQGGCNRFRACWREDLSAIHKVTGSSTQLDNESIPRNNKEYLMTRCVGSMASSRNEWVLDGSLDLFASMHDRYRLEARGYTSRWGVVSQGSSSELECQNTGCGDLAVLALGGGGEV